MLNDFPNDMLHSRPLQAIFLALFENYESIYAVDVLTSAYHCYYESEVFHELRIERSGADFFADLHENVERVISPADREYVHKTLEKDTVLEELSRNNE